MEVKMPYIVKNKKVFRIVFWVIVIAWAVFAGVKMKDTKNIILYSVLGVVALSLIIDYIWMKSFNSYINKIDEVYRKQMSRPDIYIEKIDELISLKSTMGMRNMLYINKGIGYSSMGDFQNALACFKNVDEKRLPGNSTIYWIDLCIILFHVEDRRKAAQVYDEHRDAIKKAAATSPQIEFMYLELEALLMIHRNNLKGAEAIMKDLEERYPDEFYAPDIAFIHKEYKKKQKR